MGPVGARSWRGSGLTAAAVLLVALASGGCSPAPIVVVPAPESPEPPLPPVAVEQVSEPAPAPRPGRGEPLGVPVPVPRDRPEGEQRVTLTAVGTELRALLAILAEAAGVDLVAGPAVGGRVTVHLDDVPARVALERVINETGHMIVRPLAIPYGPTVYYVLPVNVNEADAATIQARFGVSPELARFLVRSRVPPN